MYENLYQNKSKTNWNCLTMIHFMINNELMRTFIYSKHYLRLRQNIAKISEIKREWKLIN